MNSKQEEIQKLIKFIRSMQAIIRTSPNPAQVERVKKDLAKYVQKLKELVPDFNPQKETIEELQERISKPESYTQKLDSTQAQENSNDTSWETKIPITKASEHCTDPDINFLSSVLNFIQKEYWPILNEQHLHLDFTHSQERQSLRLQFDEIMRELNSVLETIEDYALAESPDFRDQLYKMKNKQTRIFMINTNDFMKSLRDFIIRLISELDKGSSVIKNPDDTIRFNQKFEEATLLEGYSIRQALTEFQDLLQYVLKKINLPDLKQKKF